MNIIKQTVDIMQTPTTFNNTMTVHLFGFDAERSPVSPMCYARIKKNNFKNNRAKNALKK